jgi:hypothetical protein
LAQLAGTQSASGREIHRPTHAADPNWTQHRGKKTKSELEVLAKRYGWKPRPDLTIADIRDMTPDEIQWRETFDKENLANGFNSDARKADAEQKRIQQQWESLAGKDLNPEGYAAANAFCKRYPQYVRSYEENNVKISKWMYENHCDPTKVESYEKAWRELANTELLLSPAAIGGSGPEVFGANNSPLRDELLKAESQRKQDKRLAEEKRKSQLTSDQWKAENRHAWIDIEGIPDLKKVSDKTRGAVIGRRNHIFLEFLEQEPRYTRLDANDDAFEKYMAAKGYNYTIPELNKAFQEMAAQGLLRVGEPVFDKAAFRYEVAKMSSDEYKRAYQDPIFRMKADSL